MSSAPALTARPHADTDAFAERLGAAVPDQLVRVELEPSARADAQNLLRALVDGAVLPRALEDRLLDVTAGNPLFIEEQVRRMISARAFESTATGWRFMGEEAFPLAPTIERALVARIDLLSDQARGSLLAASVLGLQFDGPLLDAVTGDDTGPALLELLREHVVVVDDSDGRRYRFRHALVQEAAYASMLRRQRRDLHAAAAAALAGLIKAGSSRSLRRLGDISPGLSRWSRPSNTWPWPPVKRPTFMRMRRPQLWQLRRRHSSERTRVDVRPASGAR